jgi:short-subunit dehydrogenase
MRGAPCRRSQRGAATTTRRIARIGWAWNATNAFGSIAVSRAFVPALARAAAAGGAAIVTVLSVASLASVPALGAYAASKAAAFSLTQALRSELAAQRIAVHAALPGSIDTDMVRGMEMAKTSPADVARGIVEGVEAGHDDIAPDPMARELYAMWLHDPRGVERFFATHMA